MTSEILHAPSSRLNSVWKCRWTNGTGFDMGNHLLPRAGQPQNGNQEEHIFPTIGKNSGKTSNDWKNGWIVLGQGLACRNPSLFPSSPARSAGPVWPRH